MKKVLLFIVLIFLSFCTIQAQIPQAQREAALAELQKKGLTEQEVRQRLLQKGIDIDKIDPTNPQELARAQQAIEETIRELEAEKKTSLNEQGKQEIRDQSDVIIEEAGKKIEEKIENKIQEEAGNLAKGSAEDIQKAVEQGASVEEAIAEELTENATQSLTQSPIYGQHIFRNQSIQVYRQSRDFQPPDSYVLGAGDKISISIWGISQADFTYEINSAGYIQPSSMPRIYLKGISYGKAKQLLRSRFSQYFQFRPEEFELTISAARTITVNIFGEAVTYGSFVLPAINTAFNALVAAGGPSDIGSVRDIRLIRGNQTKIIDVYKFMKDPQVQYDFFLENNDIIYIPVAERVVDITGAIKRPFRYELIDREHLMKLIEYAGGLRVDAYQKNIQITRIVEDKEIIIDVDLRQLKESGGDFELLNGDRVIIKTIPESAENVVEIRGAVKLPGQYALQDNMRISDLLSQGLLKDEARLDFAYLQRLNEDKTISYERLNLRQILDNPASSANLQLKKQDRLTILSKTKYVDQAVVTSSGALREPGEFPYDPERSMKIEDLVLLSGGLQPNATAYAYIQRVDTSNLENREFIRINILNALQNPDSEDNIVLRPFDRVTVYSNEIFTDEATVTVGGAVRNPGEYTFSTSLTINDVLTMSGGLKLEASRSRIDVYRIIIREDEPTEIIAATIRVDDDFNVISEDDDFILFPYDKIVVREVPDFEFQRFVTVTGEVNYPGPYALLNKKERLSSVIQRSGGLTQQAFPEGATLYRNFNNTGYVILKLDEVIEKGDNKFDYILKEGDVINVPKSKDLVTITGATNVHELYPDKVSESNGKINIAYTSGKRAGYYIKRYAGGIADNGSRSRITVEHPNGEVKKAVNFGLFAIYPKVREGSVIKVGTKPPEVEKPQREEREPVDWEKIVANTMAQATAVITLILLLERL